MSEERDGALVDAARRGDRGAFTELVRRSRDKVYAMILGLTRNRQDADDLLQETYLHAFRALGRFRGDAGFATWVYRIGANLTLNHLKRRSRERNRAEFDEGRIPADPAPGSNRTPEAASAAVEFERGVEEAVGALPPLFKAAFVLVVEQGMSHAEAARILGCSENTVAWRMHKARKLLRAILKPFLNEARHEM